jgi:hypothetical protein
MTLLKTIVIATRHLDRMKRSMLAGELPGNPGKGTYLPKGGSIATIAPLTLVEKNGKSRRCVETVAVELSGE